jgi:hypothetical protein
VIATWPPLSLAATVAMDVPPAADRCAVRRRGGRHGVSLLGRCTRIPRSSR